MIDEYAKRIAKKMPVSYRDTLDDIKAILTRLEAVAERRGDVEMTIMTMALTLSMAAPALYEFCQKVDVSEPVYDYTRLQRLPVDSLRKCTSNDDLIALIESNCKIR